MGASTETAEMQLALALKRFLGERKLQLSDDPEDQLVIPVCAVAGLQRTDETDQEILCVPVVELSIVS